MTEDNSFAEMQSYAKAQDISGTMRWTTMRSSPAPSAPAARRNAICSTRMGSWSITAPSTTAPGIRQPVKRHHLQAAIDEMIGR